MRILFLSHCNPALPNKGEKTRAHFELLHLARMHEVHLVCFARGSEELAETELLRDVCRSIYVEPFERNRALAAAAVRFAMGACLNEAFYRSATMASHVSSLAREIKPDAAVVYTAVMAQYVPPGLPHVVDFVDVDSEKWVSYARDARPGLGYLYAVEAKRMRRLEAGVAAKARQSLFTTGAEEALFRSVCGSCNTTYLECGVDFDYFDPAALPIDAALAGRRFALFLGSMDYRPNADAAVWFAEQVVPECRRAQPGFEFFIVGRNPHASVRRLASIPGVTVTAGVPDTRPYLRACAAVVAPLKIARGIQNKVLEGLAMGKRVFVSPEVERTFGASLPLGVETCPAPPDYAGALMAPLPDYDVAIRDAARARFTWPANLTVLDRALNYCGIS